MIRTLFRRAVAMCTVLALTLYSVSPFGLSPRSGTRLQLVATSRRVPRPCSRSDEGQQRRRKKLMCGLQILVRIRGKKSREEDYTNQAYDEYAKRLRPVLRLETHWHKTDDDLEAAVSRDKGVVVCLDERGPQMTSEAFTGFLFSKLEEGGSRVTFVVGGAEGLPPGLKRSPPHGGAHLSLSSMTFTHLWARALLAEQIYRASEIRRGSQYHKE